MNASKQFGISLEEQLALRINRELSQHLDDVILKVQRSAKKFSIQEVKERSPFRNTLAVATEMPTSLEVIKNFIRYQAGRTQSNRIWIQKSQKDSQKRFADEVVDQLNSLAETCKLILDSVELSISKELQEKDSIPIPEERLKNLQDLQKYIFDNKQILIQSVHLKLVQLYLGYLSREHTALLKEK